MYTVARCSSSRPWVLSAAAIRASSRSFVCASPRLQLPMKAGVPIEGLKIFKDKDAPVTMERDEYPEWLGSLAKPFISLAQLRRMPDEQATDDEKQRYLRLLRRSNIRSTNEAMRKK